MAVVSTGNLECHNHGGGRATHKIATMMMVKVTIMVPFCLPTGHGQVPPRDAGGQAPKQRQWRHIRDWTGGRIGPTGLRG